MRRLSIPLPIPVAQESLDSGKEGGGILLPRPLLKAPL